MTVPFVPSPDEITAACHLIRAGWTDADHEYRLTHAVDQQVTLLAAILRPMAIAAGMVPAQLPNDDN